MALFLILLFCATTTTSLPIEDDDVVIIISDDFLSSNRIEGDGEIDVSDLGPQAYGVPTNESGAALTEWTESSLMNPEEMGGYLEGDILIPGLARNGMRDKTARWTNGIIPYIIDGGYTQEQKDTIRKAIADYHRLTCLRFVPYSGQSDYIIIKSSKTGCWSSVGRLGGRQEVNLQAPGCVSKKGTVLHELLHAIGFMHEQSRPERDDFVTINYDNVKPGTEINFKKSDVKRTDNFGIGYDYNSVMHYSEFAFSRNSKKTIDPKISNTKIGQREGLSRGDVKKVNNMYNCKKEEPQTGWLGSIWQSFFGDKQSDSDVVIS
ncbi:low choriolytic enzyme-like isoform X1 [Pieris brassicae]|uniref:Metalloendopeptidase n=1 Tax=Pieris brassicae TaxID=7116 RepID=A0A9P0TH83_PIEBR|nr:low choriolytic enzyme-like isoform X1 [Pieris brassicae]CAH4028096.1 unnamed protein product [Pieris brassicae]